MDFTTWSLIYFFTLKHVHMYLKYGDKPVWLANKDCGVILGLPNDATHAFLSRCLSSLANASLSPPIQTGDFKSSTSKPEVEILLVNKINIAFHSYYWDNTKTSTTDNELIII